MKALVADASALLRVILSEPGHGVVRKVLTDRQMSGGAVLVPSTLWIEVVNVLARRYRFTGAEMMEAIYQLDRIGLQTRDMGREWTMPLVDVCERYQLSAYDAGYLVLAQATKADLITADRSLARAAGPHAVFVDADGRIAEPPAPYEVPATWPSWRGAPTYLGHLRRQANNTDQGWLRTGAWQAGD